MTASQGGTLSTLFSPVPATNNWQAIQKKKKEQINENHGIKH